MTISRLAVLLACCLWAASPVEAQTASAHDGAKAAGDGIFELFVDRGDLFVRAGTAQGVQVGGVMTILGPKIGDTHERRTVGQATVLEVWETLARVNLDKAAASYTGQKMARLEKPAAISAPPPPSSPPPPPPSNEPPKLRGHAKKMGPRIMIYNDGATTWTGCELRLPSNKRYLLDRLEGRHSDGIMIVRFAQDGIPRDLHDTWLQVTCAQGQARFSM